MYSYPAILGVLFLSWIAIHFRVYVSAGADSGFLERGFICIKVLGFPLLILSHFLKYPMKMK